MSPNLVKLKVLNDAPHRDEPIETLSRQVLRMFNADGLLVTLHHCADRMTLFADPRSDLETMREMQQCAACAALSDGPANTWFVAESKCGEMLIAPISVEHGLVTITALFKQAGAASSGFMREIATRTLPLVEPFFQLWSQRFISELRLRGLKAAVNGAGVGIALVARNGKLIFANSACETLMAEGNGIRRIGPIICGASLTDTLRLQATIDHIVTTDAIASSERSTVAPVLAIERPSRRPLLVAVVAVDNAPGGADERLAVVYFFDPDANLQPTLGPVCKFYGLSPVEAKLTCLLAGGIGLAEAAERMHVRELTARSYLKQIFMKTDTNRQAELVCLMLKSAVRMISCQTNLI